MPNDVSRPKKRMAVVKIKVRDRKRKTDRKTEKRETISSEKYFIIIDIEVSRHIVYLKTSDKIDKIKISAENIAWKNKIKEEQSIVFQRCQVSTQHSLVNINLGNSYKIV